MTPMVSAQVAGSVGLPTTERQRRGVVGLEWGSPAVARTGYVGGGSQSKMKLGGPLFKKIIRSFHVVTVEHETKPGPCVTAAVAAGEQACGL